MKKRALCIIAHPDDEIIWMGGKILREKDWDWTILCLCRSSDQDRAPKFRKVCEFLEAKGIIKDLDDEGNEISQKEIIKEINSGLGEDRIWDSIFTHGKNGEYGHQRHKEIHKTVKEMISNNTLTGELWFFSYELGKERSELNDMNICIAKKGDLNLELTEEELEEKKRLVRDVYGYPEEGFEVMCCGKKESFVRS